MEKGKNTKKAGPALRVLTAALSAIMIFTLQVCAGQSVQASSDMVGKAEIIKNLNGFTQLGAADRDAVLDALNRKYDKKKIRDMNKASNLNMNTKMDDAAFAGIRMDVNINLDINIGLSMEDSLLESVGTGKAGTLFMKVPVRTASYTDYAAGTQYAYFSMGEDTTGWIKDPLPDEEMYDPADGRPAFEKEKIRAVYQDPAKKRYAVVMRLDTASFMQMTGMGSRLMLEAGIADMDLSEIDFIVTLDKGLSVTGTFADLKDAFKDTDRQVSKCILTTKIQKINSGFRTSLPGELKK